MVNNNENREFRPSNASAVQRFGNHHFDGAARRAQPDEEILYGNFRAELAKRGIQPSYADWVEGLAKAERNHEKLISDPLARARANAALHRLLERVHEEFYPNEGND